ncbi:hypothetical protein [Cryptosporangium sp. NPDC048952]|uniref:hypothetical protein n=1 Tax=Cryptosporangium sp. NPDC048952 TaxID=3363961 RepID=UPI00371ABE8C
MHRVVLIHRTTHADRSTPTGTRPPLQLVTPNAAPSRATAVRATVRRRQRQWRLSLFATAELVRGHHRSCPHAADPRTETPRMLRVIVGVRGSTYRDGTRVADAMHAIAYEVTIRR